VARFYNTSAGYKKQLKLMNALLLLIALVNGLDSALFIELSIYNLKGQLVDCICKEKQNSGYHSYKWNPNSISLGIYLIKLTADSYTDIRRCVYSQ
jgi:hypothetical protein